MEDERQHCLNINVMSLWRYHIMGSFSKLDEVEMNKFVENMQHYCGNA